MWKSNADPWCPLQTAEWRSYSDIENGMIEEAFNKKETHVLLDDFHIIFKHFIQISNTDEKNQRPVKRCIVNKTEDKLREKRFFANAITPTKVFTEGWPSESIFIKATLEHFDLNNYPLSDYQRHMLVDSACKGLLIEGKKAGKLREAMRMEQQLIMVKNGTEREIAETCARLYTMESFLYKKLNECMNLQRDDIYENFWRSKVSTLGPFACLRAVQKWRHSLGRWVSAKWRKVARMSKKSGAAIVFYFREAKKNLMAFFFRSSIFLSKCFSVRP